MWEIILNQNINKEQLKTFKKMQLKFDENFVNGYYLNWRMHEQYEYVTLKLKEEFYENIQKRSSQQTTELSSSSFDESTYKTIQIEDQWVKDEIEKSKKPEDFFGRTRKLNELLLKRDEQ